MAPALPVVSRSCAVAEAAGPRNSTFAAVGRREREGRPSDRRHAGGVRRGLVSDADQCGYLKKSEIETTQGREGRNRPNWFWTRKKPTVRRSFT